MATILARIIKYGWQNFSRNKWLSVATISILVLTLFVFQWLILFRVVSEMGIESLKDKIDISIYFKEEVDEAKILAIKKTIESNSEVKQVEYISPDKALETFKERHSNDPTINKALAELEKNPLSASLNIKANDPAKYPVIATYIESQTNWQPMIEKLNYRQNKTVIERLARVVDVTEKIGFVLTIFLALAAILVTFNTISLAIYASREEIGIMRLVGAANRFIVGPFVFTGILYSLIAAFAATFLSWPLVSFVSPYLNSFLLDINLYTYFMSNFFSLLGFQILFGLVLGVVSSVIAISKYLKI